jgi:hypothetical protein
MAQCKKCKANVGCGCNLKDGMCSYCYGEMKKQLIVNSKPEEQDVKSKTDELPRMW